MIFEQFFGIYTDQRAEMIWFELKDRSINQENLTEVNERLGWSVWKRNV